MLGELIHASPPARPPQGSPFCVRRWLLPARGGSAGGKSPSGCLGLDLEPESRLQRMEAAPVLHSLSPEPGKMLAERSRSPRRTVRAGCGSSCCGRTEMVRVSFPRATEARGQEGGVRGSSVHHRTKNRMSTTSKMMKRTIIAHHCRRSGRKRKRQSSCFTREGKSGEGFSSLLLGAQV